MINTTADRVAKAIHAEGTVDPRTARVMIKDQVNEILKDVEAGKKEKETAQRKQSQPTNSQSAKNTRGATEGGALVKNKSPTKP